MPVDRVPAFNAGGTLPPYDGDPRSRQDRSPYDVTMGFLISRFGQTRHRLRLINGLIEYRKILHDGGFRVGYQWVDGSFVEDAETVRGRNPGDIDIVTLFHRPLRYQTSPTLWQAESTTIFATFFSSSICKANYFCDTFPIDLDKNPLLIVDDVNYWFGLFSHQKVTNVWKGMLRIPLLTSAAEYSNELLLLRQAEGLTHA
jgi:hypothetical protein